MILSCSHDNPEEGAPKALLDSGGPDTRAPVPANAFDSGTADAPSDTITLSGAVYAFAEGPNTIGSTLAGVTVCVLDTDACQKTRADGRYTIVVPRGEPFGVSYEADGYHSVIRLGQWDMDVPLLGATTLFTIERSEVAVEASGGDPTRIAETGMVHFVGLTENPSGFDLLRAGVTVTLEPNAGVGPVYVDETGSPAPGLSMTSAAGWGLFVNVPEGEYVVRFSDSGVVCDDTHPLGGWPADDPEAVTTIVRPGYTTMSMQLSCIDP